MTSEELIEILAKHKVWCESGPGGKRADLRDADLSGADLRGANLSQAKWLPTANEWLANFERDADGLIVWKAIRGTSYPPPADWKFEPGAVLIETCNPDRGTLCGSGVNFGTRAFVETTYPQSDIWRCRIRWIDLADVVVPFGTDGKARCHRLELIERVKEGKP